MKEKCQRFKYVQKEEENKEEEGPEKEGEKVRDRRMDQSSRLSFRAKVDRFKGEEGKKTEVEKSKERKVKETTRNPVFKHHTTTQPRQALRSHFKLVIFGDGEAAVTRDLVDLVMKKKLGISKRLLRKAIREKTLAINSVEKKNPSKAKKIINKAEARAEAQRRRIVKDYAEKIKHLKKTQAGGRRKDKEMEKEFRVPDCIKEYSEIRDFIDKDSDISKWISESMFLITI